MYYSEEALAYLLAVKEGYIVPVRDDIAKLRVEISELRDMVDILAKYIKKEPSHQPK